MLEDFILHRSLIICKCCYIVSFLWSSVYINRLILRSPHVHFERSSRPLAFRLGSGNALFPYRFLRVFEATVRRSTEPSQPGWSGTLCRYIFSHLQLILNFSVVYNQYNKEFHAMTVKSNSFIIDFRFFKKKKNCLCYFAKSCIFSKNNTFLSVNWRPGFTVFSKSISRNISPVYAPGYITKSDFSFVSSSSDFRGIQYGLLMFFTYFLTQKYCLTF